MKSKGRFTQKAEQAIESAGKAASELGHSYVGTEHLLLGIVAQREGLGSRILEKRGMDGKRLRRAIEACSGSGSPFFSGQSLSPRARLAMEKAAAGAEYMHQVGPCGKELGRSNREPR